MGNMNTELQTHTNSFRKCIGEYREWRKRTGLFIWVSGNRLFDAGLKPGDEVIAMDDLYGGTYRLFTKIYKDSGILFHFVDMNDMEKFKSLINENTKLVWVETPTNPMMKLVDIEAIDH
jgi:cystathionine beta-lyase/cystathionine gamma-synthase